MRWIRSFLLALLFSLLLGLAFGTWLRMRLERSPVYIGGLPEPPAAEPPPAEPRVTVDVLTATILRHLPPRRAAAARTTEATTTVADGGQGGGMTTMTPTTMTTTTTTTTTTSGWEVRSMVAGGSLQTTSA